MDRGQATDMAEGLFSRCVALDNSFNLYKLINYVPLPEYSIWGMLSKASLEINLIMQMFGH